MLGDHVALLASNITNENNNNTTGPGLQGTKLLLVLFTNLLSHLMRWGQCKVTGSQKELQCALLLFKDPGEDLLIPFSPRITKAKIGKVPTNLGSTWRTCNFLGISASEWGTEEITTPGAKRHGFLLHQSLGELGIIEGNLRWWAGRDTLDILRESNTTGKTLL